MSDDPTRGRLPAALRPARDGVRVTRRVINIMLSSAGLSLFGPARAEVGRKNAATATQPLPATSLQIIRPDDFLILEIEFDNLRLEAGPPSRLVRIDSGKIARLILHHQP
jgi:hypothetical protein